ncbi:MAG: hypothetical protein CMH22_01470 [Methylophaga sp.]|uniref:hypothetical protein n=1 Tax=Methylophaga sp. UBA678 TaxID=1946901 RepID=UPI000C6ACE11|nr:hypothetical protein [Methylophaga sp. UBA678]MAX50632.1 hypothetical protein [Methylophaga sp.]|tara:strand:- start:3168 stop:3548 length:381 start_codon:yes stop_codon:yes gene_type:complete
MKTILFTSLFLLATSSAAFAQETYDSKVHTEAEILAMLPEGAGKAFTGPIVRNYNDCVKGVSDPRIQSLSPRTIPQCNCTLDYVANIMIPNKMMQTSNINRTMIHRPEQCRVENPTKVTKLDSVVR